MFTTKCKKISTEFGKAGICDLEKSPKDARSLCVVMSKQGLRFRKDMEELTDEVHQALFSEFSNEEITQYYQLSIKLMHGSII